VDANSITFEVVLNDLDPTSVKVFRENGTDSSGKPYFMWTDTSGFDQDVQSSLKDRFSLGNAYYYEYFKVVDSSSIDIDGQTLVYWELKVPSKTYQTENYTYIVKDRTIRIADGSGVQIAGNYHVLSYLNNSGVEVPSMELSWVVNAVSFNQLELNSTTTSPVVFGAFILMIVLIIYLIYHSPRFKQMIGRG